MNKAIVVGSINMDIVSFVESLPRPGETVFGREVRYFPGGKGLNQAVACKRLGCDTQMVGCLGDDSFGEQLLAFQLHEGIDVSRVRRIRDTATGTAFIAVADDSENSIIVISGANMQWNDDSVDDLSIEKGDVVLAQFEIPDKPIRMAFEKAKDCCAMTILNPAPVRTIESKIRELVDVLVINEHELVLLSGCNVDTNDDASIFHAAQRLCDDGFRTLIITLGDKGVRVWTGGQRYAVVAKAVTAIDTTGAGDTFIGGLAAGLLSGLDLLRAVELGNVAASISVTRPGAASSIPAIVEVMSIFNGDEG